MHAIETLVLEFGEIMDDAVSSVESAAILKDSNLLNEYSSGSIDGSVSVRNIGKGADWSVIVLTITGVFLPYQKHIKKYENQLKHGSLFSSSSNPYIKR
jgi:hypothetical protein